MPEAPTVLTERDRDRRRLVLLATLVAMAVCLLPALDLLRPGGAPGWAGLTYAPSVGSDTTGGRTLVIVPVSRPGLVLSVVHGGPARAAGLRSGDVRLNRIMGAPSGPVGSSRWSTACSMRRGARSPTPTPATTHRC